MNESATTETTAPPLNLEARLSSRQKFAAEAIALLNQLEKALGDVGAVGVKYASQKRALPERGALPKLLQQAAAQLQNASGEVRSACDTLDRLKRQAQGLEQERRKLWIRLLDWLQEKVKLGESRRQRLEQVRATMAQQEQAVGAAREKGAGLAGQSVFLLEHYASGAAAQLGKQSERLAALLQESAELRSWEPSLWSDWRPGPLEMAAGLRVGVSRETPQAPGWAKAGDLSRKVLLSRLKWLEAPALAPLIGANRTVLLRFRPEEESQATDLMHAMITRLAAMMPSQASFTLLDPSGHGSAFPMARQLPRVRPSGDDLHAELRDVVGDIRRVNQEVLGFAGAFHELSEEIRASEQFEFIFAANFPRGYDRRAIETLYSIGNTGPKAGRYLFLHCNPNVELPRDLPLSSLENAFELTLQGKSLAPAGYQFQLDTPPTAELQHELLQRVRDAQPVERPVVWSDVADLPRSRWWQGDARKMISAPVGMAGMSRKLDVWFGVNSENRPCAHGMLGAMTGSGKSNLYHALIIGLATRYSPQALRMYLIDGKDGVELEPYRRLPHAAVVSLRSSAELSRSVLEELLQEKERRNALFAEQGVTDYASYCEQGSPAGELPRLLLLIDEYQELFEDDKEGQASNFLLQLAQQGRSAGIHMLLGSQRFGAPGMLNQTAIFGNFHLRMAMKMAQGDVHALTEFGAQGKQRIRSCDLPGKIVINDQTGDDNGNHYGKVALLPHEDRLRRVQELADLSRQSGVHSQVPPTIVFSGADQPQLEENSLLRARWAAGRMTPEARQAWARQPAASGGLGFERWDLGEQPVAGWLGQEFNVHGHAALVLRRTHSQHVLCVGADNDARIGALAGWLASAAALHPPAEIEFRILDRSLEGSPAAAALQGLVEQYLQPLGFAAWHSNAAEQAGPLLEQLTAELQRRLQSEGASRPPSLIAVINELDRLPLLRRNQDISSRQPQPELDQLRQLLLEGPSVGIHLILSASSLNAARFTLDERRDLTNISHRIVFQMKEDDSYVLARSRAAAALQNHGARPVVSLAVDLDSGDAVRFKPYQASQILAALRELARPLAGG